jgi:hypothetical protein
MSAPHVVAFFPLRQQRACSHVTVFWLITAGVHEGIQLDRRDLSGKVCCSEVLNLLSNTPNW